MKKISTIQKFAWFYGISLLIIASLRWIPGVTDSHGLLFGLFQLDWLDDIIHTLTGLWGVFGALVSARQSAIFFRGIGLLYTIDAIIGLAYGQNPFHIGFWGGEALLTGLLRILVNIPHLLGGLLALYLGFYLGKEILKSKKKI
jgi:hypothetical protein